jgi:hypothetical protein
VDAAILRVDHADVRQTADELTLILGAAGVHITLIRLRYDGWVDEVTNSDGSTAHGPGAWTLTSHASPLNSAHGPATLSFPRECRLRLDVDDYTIRQHRTSIDRLTATPSSKRPSPSIECADLGSLICRRPRSDLDSVRCGH